ncbi:MAG TPA: molybdopterin cofactor-binding domain-containing protein [Bryobacteraceae bacterium]|nr:molybdopterin cofactor-binding domain-containing protein [Bryobacteraceae bacterium]
MNAVHIVSRRGFLERFVSAGALVLGAPLVPQLLSAGEADQAPFHPSVYLGIEPDGTVVIVTHRSEMGTGIRSVLPVIAADELDADWKRVKIEQAIGDPKYGSQNTDGSCSIRDFYAAFRQAGATARTMLERAAAAKWQVPPGECHAQLHEIVHQPSGRKLGFGELVASAAQQPVPKKEELQFKSPANYRYIGKELPIVDLADLCSGRGTFGIDAKMPGMVYASIEHPPVFGGKLRSFDDSEVRKVPGVQQTIALDGWKPPYGFQPLGGVAVIANNTWTAMQARKKLKVEWDLGEHAAYESEAYKKSLLETARKPGKVIRTSGDVDAEFARATKIHEAEYYVPLLAHAPMEPPAAVAEFKDGKVVLWAATQNPQAVQDTVAAAVGIDKKNVTCNVTLLGGGFGRKSKPDYCAEAAVLSKKIGKPVKVVWSREDDLRFDYYHAVAGMYMKAATDAKGRPTAWLQRSVFPSIGNMFAPSADYGAPFELGMGWNNVPFNIPNQRAENGPAKNHTRIGWLRSVANIYHAFAVHSFVDELAAAANRDRVEYLLELIGEPRKFNMKNDGPHEIKAGDKVDRFPLDTGRLRRVIELAAERSDWAKKKPAKGRALGIAAHWSFYTYVAAVVEVEVDQRGQLHIPRVDLAVDPGMIINPDRVKAQFEGAAVFGTSLALMGEITAADGKIIQSNFHNYPVARMNEAPRETHVHIVGSTEAPAGVGEPGVPPMAPAICNAIFAATGKRIRELPIKKTKLV